MSRTGIERLRGLYVEWIGGDYLVALSDMIQETADQIEREHAEEIEALEPRLMPESMEWLRYNDGEKVLPTDEGIIGIEHSKTGNTVLITASDDEPRVVFAPGERVKRPKMLAADGLPIEVGQTVYGYDGRAWEVGSIEWGKSNPVLGLGEGFHKPLDPERLTHTPPDTQERIDEDATMPAATYCVSHALVDSDTDVDEATLLQLHITDLLRRQRELDKREMGGK